jgi:NitT/TauT family transport system ATP-binding protein
MEDICITGLCKAFGGKRVLRDLDLTIPAGSTLCLMAPSGAGKTTLLRILAGLEQADAGSITGLSGYRTGMVFQENRLMGGFSLVDNIRLVSPGLTRDAILPVLDRFMLRDSADQPVRELSGGMARRTALLRALLSDADLLLLDEPFTGLDQETLSQVLEETRLRLPGRTCVMATHQPEEAEALGARIVSL